MKQQKRKSILSFRFRRKKLLWFLRTQRALPPRIRQRKRGIPLSSYAFMSTTQFIRLLQGWTQSGIWTLKKKIYWTDHRNTSYSTYKPKRNPFSRVVSAIYPTSLLISSSGHAGDINSHGEFLDEILPNGIRFILLLLFSFFLWISERIWKSKFSSSYIG